MPIITISRGSYNRAKAVAEKLAHKLNYACISRDSILADLGEFHLPEIKLVRGLHDAFSVLERFSNGKERFTTAIRAALLARFCQDNVVYHGLAGHHFLDNVAHVLKVRVVADLEDRVQEERRREGIGANDARYILKKDDEERRKWCLFLYGVDIWEPSIYHMVVKVGRLSVDDVVDMLATASRLAVFQATAESRRRLDDMALAASVQNALFDFPNAVVTAVQGRVRIGLKAPEDQTDTIVTKVRALVEPLVATDALQIDAEPYY